MKKYIIMLLIIASGKSFAQLDITWPTNRMVFQRSSISCNGSTIDGATIYFAGQIYNSFLTVQYRTEKLNAMNGDIIAGTLTTWTTVALNNTSTDGGKPISTFIGNFCREKGWYRLDITNGNTTQSIKFGVGDVYIIAGQSNSSGVNNNGEEPNLTTYYGNSSYSDANLPDGVNVFNLRADGDAKINPNNADSPTNNQFYEGGRKRVSIPVRGGFEKLTQDISNNTQAQAKGIFPKGVNSWCYATMGKDMISSTNNAVSGVPIAFFNAGSGSTWVKNWTDSFDGNTTDNIFIGGVYGGYAGIPYLPLRNTLQMFGNIMGVRCILWHQGESDSQKWQNGIYSYPNGTQPNTLPFSGTKDNLKGLITKSRNDFKNGLSWAISKVSWWSVNQINNELKNRQGEVAGEDGNKLGADTDGIGMNNGLNGAATRTTAYNVHFTNDGLKLLADSWVSSQPWLANPVQGTELLPITITYNNSMNSYTLNAPNAQAWRWYRGQDLVNPVGTSQTLPVVATDNDIYICYVSNTTNENTQNFQACQPVYMKSTAIITGGGCTYPPSLPINVFANPSSTIVQGQSTVLSASCGNFATVKWSTGQNGNSIQVTPTSTTTYTLKCYSNQYGESCASSNVSIGVTVNTTTGCQNTPLTNLSPTNPSNEWQGWGTMKIGKSITDKTLSVGAYTTTVGIGTHAGSRLVYNLGGQYNTFSGSVGRDDESDNCGCGTMKVRFLIKLDGNNTATFDSQLMGTTDGRKTFNVPVTGVNTLELIVEDGGDNVYGDHADWLDPVLSCGTSTCTIPANPTNAYASSPTISSGQSTQLNVTCSSAGSAGIWSNGASGNTINVSPTTTTTYTVRCKNGTCESVGQQPVLVTVGTNPPPSGLTAGTCYTISSLTNLSNNMQAMGDGSIRRQGATGAANQIWRAEAGSATNQLKFVSAATNQYITVNTSNYADHMYLASSSNNYQSWNIETSGGYYRLSRAC